MADEAHGQHWEARQEPFTDAEILRAFRICAVEAEARALIAEIRALRRQGVEEYRQWEREAAKRKAAGLPAGAPAPENSYWSDDVLIILSLLSEELHKRVEQHYRDRLVDAGRPPNPVFLREWLERREELRSWVEEERRKYPGEIGYRPR